MNGTVLISNICYQKIDGKSLLLDILRPEVLPERPMPIIMEIHAGGWMYGEKLVERNRPFAEEGFFTLSINYRLSNEAIFPAQIEDVKAAVHWLRSHHEEYHLNPDRIGVWGISSGGHLAALLGTTGKGSEKIQAIATLSGPSDFLRMADNAFLPPLLGGPVSKRRTLAIEASPVAHVTKETPPFLIVHGTDDQNVPFEQGIVLRDALMAVGCDVTFIPIAGMGHISMDPSPEIYQAMISFFVKYLQR